MTKEDLETLVEVIQTHRFMMASAFSGSVPNNKEMQAYMGKMHQLQDRVKAEIAKCQTSQSS